MTKITWDNKETLTIKDLPERFQVTAENMNDIKDSVNWLYDNMGSGQNIGNSDLTVTTGEDRELIISDGNLFSIKDEFESLFGDSLIQYSIGGSNAGDNRYRSQGLYSAFDGSPDLYSAIESRVQLEESPDYFDITNRFVIASSGDSGEVFSSVISQYADAFNINTSIGANAVYLDGSDLYSNLEFSAGYTAMSAGGYDVSLDENRQTSLFISNNSFEVGVSFNTDITIHKTTIGGYSISDNDGVHYNFKTDDTFELGKDKIVREVGAIKFKDEAEFQNGIKNIKYGTVNIVFDGVETVFNIPHGMGVVPASINIKASDGINLEFRESDISVDATNITITCDAAPSGSMSVFWQAFN